MTTEINKDRYERYSVDLNFCISLALDESNEPKDQDELCGVLAENVYDLITRHKPHALAEFITNHELLGVEYD